MTLTHFKHYVFANAATCRYPPDRVIIQEPEKDLFQFRFVYGEGRGRLQIMRAVLAMSFNARIIKELTNDMMVAYEQAAGMEVHE